MTGSEVEDKAFYVTIDRLTERIRDILTLGSTFVFISGSHSKAGRSQWEDIRE